MSKTPVNCSTANCTPFGIYSKLNLTVTVLIFFLITNCVSFVHSEESSFLFNHGDAIKFSSESNENKLENLIEKNLFSIFSSEISILNSIEEKFDNYENKNILLGTDLDESPIGKFHPPRLDFREQQIGIPVVHTVYLINSDNEPLKLESISGSTKHFYCSFFVDKIIPVNGNSSFDVYFLARELGSVDSLLYINTNKGILKYSIKGKGIQNEHKLKPILNAKIPLNTTFTSVINLHNPTNEFLQVTEVYTSDDDLHLQVPNNEIFDLLNKHAEWKSEDLKKKIVFQNFDKNKWILEPYETKSIVVIHFMGRNANNHTAFICIKATQYSNKVSNKVPIINKTWNRDIYTHLNYNQEKKDYSFILPIELEVSQNFGIFAPYEQIDFGLVTVKQVNFKHGTFTPSKAIQLGLSNYDTADKFCYKRVVDFYLANSGPNFLSIQNISISRPNSALEIDIEDKIVLPPSIDQLTRVAKIKYDPLKSEDNNGQIFVKTNDTNVSFSISFKSDFIEGSLEYDSNKMKFLLDEKTENEQWREIDLLNTFKIPLVVYKIELNQIAENFFKIYDFNDPVLFESNNDAKNLPKRVFRLKFFKKEYIRFNEFKLKSDQNLHLNNLFDQLPKIKIFTNLTNFEIPLNIYNNLLIFKTYDETDEYSMENLSDIDLDLLELNKKKIFTFQIMNLNPEKIKKKYMSDYKDMHVDFKLKLMKNESFMENFYPICKQEKSTNKSYFLVLNHKTKIDILPFTRIVIELYIKSLISNNYQDVFISSEYLFFNVDFQTEFETRSLPVQFRVVNGSLNLIEQDSIEHFKIHLKVFPYQKFLYPLHLKSTFIENLQVESLEFNNYGNLFDFKWKELIDNENNLTNVTGLILANKTTFIGHLVFDPKLLCQDHSYIGIEPDQDYSIKKLSNAVINRLDELENASMSLVHDLWLKTFKIKNLNFLSSEKILRAIHFDSKMLKIMEQNFQNLNKLKNEFQSSLIVKLRKTKELDLNLSYSFPIEFNFERPSIALPNPVVLFEPTQIYLESKTRSISLFNPCKSSVLIQLLLLDSYSTDQQFLDLFNSFRFLTGYKNITNNMSKIFSISLISKDWNQNQKINKLLHDLDIQPEKQSIVAIMAPGEKINVNVKFSPNKLGSFENLLIIRNNLTLIETYHLKAEAGTAEIRINNQAPIHTSNFVNKEFHHMTIDQSFLDIKMSHESEICQSMDRDRIDKQYRLFTLNASLGSILEYLNVLDDSSGNCAKKIDTDCTAPDLRDTTKKWFKNNEGIVLRNFFPVTNIGSTDLFVYKILLDGEPCISQGFEIHNCRPFKLSRKFDSQLLLDIRYQPDFTRSIILKRLTLVTNIGDLEYNIRVTIPHDLLSLCHDSLPRPPLESYLIYLCLMLLIFLLTIILVSAIFESKAIINFQMTNLKTSIGRKKTLTALQVANEFNMQKEACALTKQPSSPAIIRTKSLNESETKQVKSPKAGRKQTNNYKTNELKSKSKKTNRDKENDNFGFEPLEIDIKSANSPKTHKKEDKKLAELLVESNQVLESSDAKKEKKKTKNNRQPKIDSTPSYQSISSSRSGSISTNSSGTSTPSPSLSISPVQFVESKSKTPAQIESYKETRKELANNNNNNNKMESKKNDKQILIQKTIDSTLNDLKKNKSPIEQTKLNSRETEQAFRQNLTMLNLLNILNYQQETEIAPPTIQNSNFIKNDSILNQLKELYELNHSRANFGSEITKEKLSVFQKDSFSRLTQQQNLIINSNSNENYDSFSRSVSILSKRSSSADSSNEPTNKSLKSIAEKSKNDKNGSNSDYFWHQIKEDLEFEETLVVDDFNPDDEYENMVEQTEKFDNLFFQHSRNDLENVVHKIPVNKTHSVPSNPLIAEFCPKMYSYELESNFNNHIKFGPIERPKSGPKISNCGKLNNPEHISNSYPKLDDQMNQNSFTFNEFKLFGSETKSDLDSVLESLVSSGNVQLNQNQAWNSVLLNEYNNIPTTSIQDPVDLIKNIWSD